MIITVFGSMGSSMTLFNTWLAYKYRKEFGQNLPQVKLGEHTYLDLNKAMDELNKKKAQV